MRVITFSRHFPAHHSRKGEETLFVQKILLSLLETGHISMSRMVEIGRELNLPGIQTINEIRKLDLDAKHHTIRRGNRWKEGDFFSPRIWTGRPYASKQCEFVHPVEIVKTWPFSVDECGVSSLNNFYLFEEGDTMNEPPAKEQLLAKNVGAALRRLPSRNLKIIN